jgi:hypothetical protein
MFLGFERRPLAAPALAQQIEAAAFGGGLGREEVRDAIARRKVVLDSEIEPNTFQKHHWD